MMKILVAAALVIAVVTLMALPVSFFVMLLWGAIAGTYDLPTMGFGTALQVTILSGLLFRPSAGTSKN